MTTNVIARLTGNGEALIAEVNKSFNQIGSIAKKVSQETGQYFAEDTKKGLREAEVAARASYKSIADVISSATRTNGAVQIDTSGAKEALAAAQSRLATAKDLALAFDRMTAKESDASAASRVYAATLREAVAEEARTVATLNSKVSTLDRLQAELGQTAIAQNKVTAISGNQRAGMQQLTFQINDVASSFASGISPMQIFAQQGSQVVQSIGMMRGASTGLIGFLLGPWGAALTGAATILGSLWFAHNKAGEGAEGQGKKEGTLTERIKAQNQALQQNIQLQGQKLAADLAGAQGTRTEALKELAIAERNLKQKRDDLADIYKRPSEANRGLIPSIEREIKSLEKLVNAAKAAVASIDVGIRSAQIAITDRNIAGKLDPAIAETNRYEAALGKLREERKRGIITDAAYDTKATALLKTHKANEAALQAETKAQASYNKEAERGAKLTAFRPPVDGKISSGFGSRKAPTSGASTNHPGIDYAVPTGTAVRAPAAGIIESARLGTGNRKGNGLFVRIKHGAGTESVFLHLSESEVVEGQVVQAGQVIGRSGGAKGSYGAGTSTGAHLHYGVEVDGRAVNPLTAKFPTSGDFSEAANKFDDQAAAAFEKSMESITSELQKQDEAYQRISGSISDIITGLEDTARIDALRAQGLNLQADKETELLQLRRQFRDLMNGEPEVAAKLLGITADQVVLERERLKIAEAGVIAAVQRKASEAATEKYEKREKEALEKHFADRREKQKRENEEQRRAISDLADFYQDAFDSGGKSIWQNFKANGKRILAELAAQATFSLLAGGGGNTSVGTSAAVGGGGLFGQVGTLFGGLTSGSNGGSGGYGSGGGNVPGNGSGNVPIGQNSILGQLFQSAGYGAAGGQLASLTGARGSTTGASLGGIAGGFIGGPLGSLIGGAIGSILGGLFKKTKKGSATLSFSGGELGVGAVSGNNASRRDAASAGVSSLADTLTQIAEALGGTIGGAGSVSIGSRKGRFTVDTAGRGRTSGSGVLSFATEQQAIEAALKDALGDGVITGISEASKRILASGQNLQKAIEKAVLIESIPKALKARLNPVGAALNEFNDKWDKIVAALKEGGASAEQFADAQKLRDLERADLMRAANDNLRQFVSSLNFGSSSAYSLEDQNRSVRAELAPILAQIQAGNFAAVDQEKYLELANSVNGISRELNGSGTAYFATVDELRSATQRLADGLQSGFETAAARDPFAETTASATQATADILAQHSGQLASISGYLAQIAANGGGNNPPRGFLDGGFIGADRSFLRSA